MREIKTEIARVPRNYLSLKMRKKEKAIARTESRGTLSCQQHRRARPTKRGKSRLHVANGDIEALAFRGRSQRTITKPLKTEMVATETRQNNRTL